MVVVSVRKRYDYDHGLVLNMNHTKIIPKYSARVLGLQLTADLDHSHYIANMTRKEHGADSLLTELSRRVKSIYRLKFFTTKQKLKELAAGIIFSKLSYGICYYGNCSKVLMGQIDVQINNVARIVGELGNLESTKEIMRELKWLHFEQLRNYHDQLTLDMITTTGHPRSFAIQMNEAFRPYRTRAALSGMIIHNQDTAPVLHARFCFFLSRSCRNHNLFGIFQLGKLDGIKIWKNRLRETVRRET